THNIACAVAGRRRFTLFPPDQLSNLYIGPFEHTLAGPPVSMVRLEDPDFERYPRFREALSHAVVADLDPGDALYIPYCWWHHVRSLEPFNVLVNYWWNDADLSLGEPYDCLLHGMITLRDMPPSQRTVWKAMFEHYIFGTNGSPVAHLPPEDQGAAGPMTTALRAQMKQQLLQRLDRQWGNHNG
ncbi:MAG TPA: cupin-like domain-containing protein, partial [Terriglobales bacterium]|nr:cupin-like domain-containing protein [Terriglobales bacterium]